jgi:hypothetical protein
MRREGANTFATRLELFSHLPHLNEKEDQRNQDSRAVISGAFSNV